MKIFLDKEHRVLEVCFGKDPTLIMSYDEEDGLCIENLADGDKIEIIERKLRFEITDDCERCGESVCICECGE